MSRRNWNCGGDKLGRLQLSSHCQRPHRSEREEMLWLLLPSLPPASGVHGLNPTEASRQGAWDR